MKRLLQKITDVVTTKKGMKITLSVWLILTISLAIFAPSAKDYEVSSIDSLPDDVQSVIAQKKINEYFTDNNGIPAIFVFQAKDGELDLQNLQTIYQQIVDSNINGAEPLIPFAQLPAPAASSFFSEDQTTAIIPFQFSDKLETKELKASQQEVAKITGQYKDISLYITGPAGIATDTLDLFSRADLVLLFSTVGLILILLVIIYRSPLLALIPLIAAAFVYEVVMQVLGIMGKAGLVISNQTLSIMTILLFAAVIDYSLFVFSRYREELKRQESKFEAMKLAMQETGMPVFFSGGTVLAAMLVLFFAQFGDYRNFAPTFGTTMVVIMIASITLVPALFTLFGRKSFWPKIPKVGDIHEESHGFWSKIGKFVTRKPGVAVTVISLFLILSASNLVNLQYEFDTMKSFPKDMPSRVGYEILEEKFEKGDLAPTTVLYEANGTVTKADIDQIQSVLLKQPKVNEVRVNGISDDQKAVQFSLTFTENPYEKTTIDTLQSIIDKKEQLVSETQLNGKLFFAGETATKLDERTINNRDIIVIVLLETILIFLMLIVLTRSVKMPIYMMGTILVSYLAALGLGTFLSQIFFGIGSISDRVPLYAFVFLVALGIDYNIMLISRFQEERLKHPVKKAVEIAVAHTGGVISSAGIILAATFAVLMTQPIQLLFVFGFIVAVGILLDTFLIRGILLPGIIVFLEKDKTRKELKS
ncbi:MMPL family transporter [Bacillus kwashiorkori]|uniref:MMPL family transporter n=1 Tax=Bacillus kwashiorkori TaxID=1522318 RepID=UPI0007829402|nr:MMPL family transporter [Bacillus kwashiorkori]